MQNSTITPSPAIAQDDFSKKIDVNLFDAKLFIAAINARLHAVGTYRGSDSADYQGLSAIRDEAIRLFDREG